MTMNSDKTATDAKNTGDPKPGYTPNQFEADFLKLFPGARDCRFRLFDNPDESSGSLYVFFATFDGGYITLVSSEVEPNTWDSFICKGDENFPFTTALADPSLSLRILSYLWEATLI